MNGYENDYDGATAEEYVAYVNGEYDWRVTNYIRQPVQEANVSIRNWITKTYPDYKFSVTLKDGNFITIKLLSADFPAFPDEEDIVACCSLSNYGILTDKRLTHRATDVMHNIKEYAMTFNRAYSDPTQDYSDRTFYLSLYVGDFGKHYEVKIPEHRMFANNKLN